jgi:hypothetical protein
MRFDSMAVRQWMMPVAWTIGPGDEWSTCVSMNADQNFVISGVVSGPSFGGFDYSLTIMGEFWTWKAGNTFGWEGDELSVQTLVLSDGGYLIIGTSSAVGPANVNAYVVRTDTLCDAAEPVVFTTGLDPVTTRAGTTSRIYPVPAESRIVLLTDPLFANQEIDLSILDPAGRCLHRLRLMPVPEGTEYQIELPQLAPGWYVMHLQTTRAQAALRLIIR